VGEIVQLRRIETPFDGQREILAQQGMFGHELVDELAQFGESERHGEQFLLFGGEVVLNLGDEDLRDLALPSKQIDVTGLDSTIQTDTKCQGVLVLMREWDEVPIAPHPTIIAL
jgi:hypothetical protein